MVFNIITSIFLGITLITLLYFFLNKSEKLLQKYIFIFYIPLILILSSCYYVGSNYINAVDRLFNSIVQAIATMFFRANINQITVAYKQDLYFCFIYYITTLSVISLNFLVIINLFFKQTVNLLKHLFITNNNYVVITSDYSDDTKRFLKSYKKAIVIYCENDGKELDSYNEQYSDDIKTQLMESGHIYYSDIKQSVINKLVKKHSIFISFVDNNKLNLELLNKLRLADNECYIKIDNSFTDTFNEIVKDKSNIHLFNKYDLIAENFILNTPISKYIDDSIIDRKTCLLKEDNDINVFMIGFGKVNLSLYLELIQNNNYAKVINNKISTYKVNYYLYDRDPINKNKLNFTIDRCKYYEFNKEEYYPKYDDTFKTNQYLIDINEFNFFKNIYNNLALKGLNTFIISLGDDVNNLELAMKLYQQLLSLNNESKFIIYVRMKEKISMDLPSELIPFGYDEDIINKDVIINENLLNLAKIRASIYSDTEDIEKNWRNLTYDKRLSNKESINGFIHQLHLLGLEICDESGLNKEDFLKLYDLNNEIKYDDTNDIIYDLNFSDNLNPRNVLAFIEHNRWVNEMLVKGYMPMKIKDICVKNNKLIKDDINKKLHACITSYDGLDIYFDDTSKLLSNNLNISYWEAYKQVENKHYDYEVMDNAFTFLDKINKNIKLKQ